MDLNARILIFLLPALLAGSCQRSVETRPFRSYWDTQPDRCWAGPEYWANRLQDWQLSHGRLECIRSDLPKRTLHLLNRYLSNRPGSLEMQVILGGKGVPSTADEGAWAGFLIGAGTQEMDYRRRSLIQGAYGRGGGFITALTPDGRILVIDNETGSLLNSVSALRIPGSPLPDSYLFSLRLNPHGNQYKLLLTAENPQSREVLVRLDTLLSREGNFSGNMALICNGAAFWFEDWEVRGSKIRVAEDHKLGPVIGTQYTLSNRILKLTAQLAPLSESDEQTVELQVRDAGSGRWNTMARSQIRVPGYLACFRVGDWNDDLRYDYRILYHLTDARGARKPYYYYGVIVQDPGDRDEIRVAAFTGNSNSYGSIQGKQYNFRDRLWFPHEDLTSHVAMHHPDLLVYTGDNVYEGRPTPPDFSSEWNTGLDYLYKWYLFLWAHGGLTRNIPSVTIPDDHDVYHGNLWGASGARAPARPPGGVYPDYYRGYEGYWQQDQGGYKLSPALVNMIQMTQTSHLPDPFDPEPVLQGIKVYYCRMNYGRISWAILEDRKFKSAPSRVHPEYRIVNGFSLLRGIDGRQLDSPDASLLGERQLSFIRDWASDWTNADMKVAISQTVFANLSTFPDTFVLDAQTPQLPVLSRGEIPKDYRKARDMDSDGWPQSGRDRALRELRKGFAVMIGGDQHLGSVIHHGIDDWEDAGYSFCVPSIANLWPRRWFPPVPGQNHKEGMPPYTGRYFDGFGNRMTVLAVSNPYRSNREPVLLNDRAPGYGIIRINRNSQHIVFECWPRYVDPESANARQYPGWPVELNLEDNYARKASDWLPPVRVSGLKRPPVVQLVDEVTGEIIYTRRLTSFVYRAPVFDYSTYTLRLGEPGTSDMKIVGGLIPGESGDTDTLSIQF